MGAKHPKPDFRGKEKPPYGPWMEWSDRQLQEAIGEHRSLKAALAAAGADLGPIMAELADHEARIAALEAAGAAYRATPYMARNNQIGGAANTSYFHQISGQKSAGITTVEADHHMPMPHGGTFKSLYYQNSTPTATDATPRTWSWTLRVNGVDTALTVTGIDSAATGQFTDTTHSVSVVAGDLVCFHQRRGPNPVLLGGCGPMWSVVFEAAV